MYCPGCSFKPLKWLNIFIKFISSICVFLNEISFNSIKSVTILNEIICYIKLNKKDRVKIL